MKRIEGAFAAAIAVVALLAPPAVAEPAQNEPTQNEPVGLSIEMIDRSPWVDAGGTLTLDVGAGAPVEAVSVTVHGRLDSPTELAASRDQDEGAVIFTGVFPLADATSLGDTGSEDPTSKEAFRFSFDISDTINEGSTIRMAFAGVYPVVITPLDADGNPGQEIRTPVIRRSGAGTTLHAPALSIVVDLSTPPTATAGAARRPFDDGELARFSRLADLLERADPNTMPITVLANTQTIIALGQDPDPAASRLVAALSTPGAVVVPQPTIPVDWPVLADAGLDHMLDDLIEDGRAVIDALDVEADTLTWDARGGIDDASLAAIAAAGYRRVLITPDTSGSTVDDPESSVLAKRDRTIIGAPAELAVIAVDEATAAALVAPIQGSDADHVALADLVLRSPDPATAVAVVIDDAPLGSSLMSAINLIGQPGSPVATLPLDVRVDREAASELDRVTPTTPDPTETAAVASLAPEIADGLTSVDLYASITGEADETTRQARELIAASVQRGLARDERSILIAGAAQLTSAIIDNVHLSGPRDLNLTSRTGTLPIGVVNDGPSPVTLVLAARSDRLSFPPDETQTAGPTVQTGGQLWHTITIEVPPGEIRVDLAVQALASGSVPLTIEVLSPDGTVVLDSRQFNVRSTAVSGAGLLISIGALVVLVVWWFRTWRKARIQERVTPDLDA